MIMTVIMIEMLESSAQVSCSEIVPITSLLIMWPYILVPKFYNDFILTLRASFTKQGNLAQERNSKTAPMAVGISVLLAFQIN